MYNAVPFRQYSNKVNWNFFFQSFCGPIDLDARHAKYASNFPKPKGQDKPRGLRL
ncbi:hypothetical protein HMPREF1249_0908 [Jonquetella sp. BV3C21]|nr:hypothetical protein GCWU000246_00397 [Jonquetella anthropi E3_33 E1]ERL23444.1 hypothetical protein HMPREF1249_0908 [Jonquetella sp. BV3C21]